MFQPFPNPGGTATADPQIAGLNGQSRVPEMFGNVIAGTIPGAALPYGGFAFPPTTPFAGHAFNPCFGYPTIGTPAFPGATPFVNVVPNVPTYHPYFATPNIVPPNFVTPFNTMPTSWNHPFAMTGGVTPFGVNPFIPTFCPTPSPFSWNPFWATNPAFVNWTGMTTPAATVSPFVGFTPNATPTTIHPFAGTFQPNATPIPSAIGTPPWTMGWNPCSFRPATGFYGYPYGFHTGYPSGTNQPLSNPFNGFPTPGFYPLVGINPTGITNPYGTTYEGLIAGLTHPFYGTMPWNGVTWNTPNFFSNPGSPSAYFNTICATNPTVAYSTIHPITGAPNPFFSPTQVAHGIPGFGAVNVHGAPLSGVATNPATVGHCCN